MTPTRLATLVSATAAVAAAIHARSSEAPWSTETIGGLLAQPGVFGLLALAGDAPEGFVLCRSAVDEAEVLALAVLPESRRRGHARALLAAAVAQASAAGAARLLLEVAVDNEPALALYRSAGFRPVGRRKGYYTHAPGAPADAMVMALDLKEPGLSEAASNG